ncbi:hypothetical protein TrVE_jg3057 [Triparma verrucosa]|uniref:GST N-terminal domain-containing protein n=1 Tax=Triparma verrucosa TaxID=1606542 RepID=A0A9W6Z7F9_9STRA|nr:hypothetical protein TrVE_jg3057 [Triparma verrucosa]
MSSLISTQEEDLAEAELAAAISAAVAAPDSEVLVGLGGASAMLYFPVKSDLKPQYNEGRRSGEKELVFLYLSIRGLGETIRLMLAEAQASYTHLASPMGEPQELAMEWRKRSPNGLTPIMSGLGVPRSEPLCQSSAIIRYLASRYGMDGGGGELERARCDVLFETARDFKNKAKEIVAGDYSTSGAKGAVITAGNILKMMAYMGDVGEETSAMNYGQVQLLNSLLAMDEERKGCVGELSAPLEEWLQKAAGRTGIREYLKSGMRFPNVTPQYKFDTGPMTRGDTKKI